MKNLDSKLIKALTKIAARETQFLYFPPDEIEDLVNNPKKAIAIMKNAMGNLEDKKMYLLAAVNAIDIAIPKIKELMKDDITEANLKKFDTVMKLCIDSEKKLFNLIKDYN
jgi:hypothetical protein